MPNLAISALPAAGAITGAEIAAFVQGGVASRGTITAIATYINSLKTFIAPRISTIAPGPVIVIDCNLFDGGTLDGQNIAFNFDAPAGVPVEFQKLTYRVRDNNTPQNITWDAAFTGFGVALPAITTSNKWTIYEAVYNAVTSKWNLISAITEL